MNTEYYYNKIMTPNTNIKDPLTSLMQVFDRFYNLGTTGKLKMRRCRRCGSIKIIIKRKTNKKFESECLCRTCAANKGKTLAAEVRVQKRLAEVGDDNINFFYDKIYPILCNEFENSIYEEALNKYLVHIIYILYKQDLLNNRAKKANILKICYAYLNKAKHAVNSKEVSFSDLSIKNKLQYGIEVEDDK